MLKDFTISNLLDLNETIAGELFEGKTYPWEVLPEIGEYAGLACGIILSVITPITSFFITGSPIMAAIPAMLPHLLKNFNGY